jgi:outer membrane immunogenic protein
MILDGGWLMRCFSAALITCLIMLASAQAASAADMLPVKAPIYKTPPPQAFNWTGFYIGVNGGYGWSRDSASESPGDPLTILQVTPAATSFDAEGWLGGIQAGYNWQFDEKWVVGLETDFEGANIKGDGSAAVTMAASPGTFGASPTVNWFGTVRPRLGYLPANNVLLFVTGGFAYGKVDQSANVTIAPGSAFGPAGFGFS